MFQALKQFGFDVLLFLAGLSGGFVFLSKNSRLNRWEKFISVLSGGLTANYLTPVVAKWINLSEDTVCGTAFLLGYGGLKSVESLYTIIINRTLEKERAKGEENKL